MKGRVGQIEYLTLLCGAYGVLHIVISTMINVSEFLQAIETRKLFMAVDSYIPHGMVE